MIWRQTTTTGINFCISTNCSNPCYKMLEKTLVKLMKNAGCDWRIDVNEWEIFQKNTLNRFNPCISTCICKFSCSFINWVEGLNDFSCIARLKNTIPIADVITMCRTDGTVPCLYERDQYLLWIITYISGKNRITSSNSTVPLTSKSPSFPAFP